MSEPDATGDHDRHEEADGMQAGFEGADDPAPLPCSICGQTHRSAPPLLDQDDGLMATVLAMGVRNALEGTLHGGHLGDLSITDEQMAILNPIVRNAIATGLHALEHYSEHLGAREYWDFQRMLIPDYWEPAELLDDYWESWAHFADQADIDAEFDG